MTAMSSTPPLKVNLPSWFLGAVVSSTALATDRLWVVGFWSALGLIRIFIVEVLILHAFTSLSLLAAHGDLHECTTFTSLSDFEKTAFTTLNSFL